MTKKCVKWMLPVVLATCLFAAKSPAWAQDEGALHNVFRHIVAIPYALLGSLKGPDPIVCSQNNVPCPSISYNIMPPYIAVAPTAIVQTAPSYVTYNAISVQKPMQAECPPNAYIYDPIPFRR